MPIPAIARRPPFIDTFSNKFSHLKSPAITVNNSRGENSSEKELKHGKRVSQTSSPKFLNNAWMLMKLVQFLIEPYCLLTLFTNHINS
uniref:Uncharacterized protein n=1 Tax=Megaselia scalaris TaxID=36166 RepID=T1GES5_MEGSC